MTTSWVVTIVGVVVALLGWYLTPNAWGYGLFGHGLAWVLLGVLSMFREPARNR